MGVSKNRGYPQTIHFNRVFHYKPSILGYPYFRKHPDGPTSCIGWFIMAPHYPPPFGSGNRHLLPPGSVQGLIWSEDVHWASSCSVQTFHNKQQTTKNMGNRQPLLFHSSPSRKKTHMFQLQKKKKKKHLYWVFPKIGVPKNGWWK